MSSFEQLYKSWKQHWELVNPRPKPSKPDRVKLGLLIVVATGSIILSGTRTGNSVADIGSFSGFAIKLFGEAIKPQAVAVEGLLAMATIEAAILLAGYTWPSKKINDNWYYFLLVGAAITAVLTNVLPGWLIIEEWLGLTGFGHVVVSIVVGLSAPVLAFVAGSLLKQDHMRRIAQDAELEVEWLSTKKAAWTRSSEYRQWRKTQTAEEGMLVAAEVKPVEVKPVDILSLLNSKPKAIPALLELYGKSEDEFNQELESLVAKGLVERYGALVKKIEFS